LGLFPLISSAETDRSSWELSKSVWSRNFRNFLHLECSSCSCRFKISFCFFRFLIQRQQTPLICASLKGHAEVVHALLECKSIEINRSDEVICRGSFESVKHSLSITYFALSLWIRAGN
jgi:hypothetical protein